MSFFSLQTITDAMSKSEVYKQIICEVNKLVSLYLTFPVTTATAERSFSSLRRIKFLRSTMTHFKLNNFFIIHTSYTDTLGLTTIARNLFQ